MMNGIRLGVMGAVCVFLFGCNTTESGQSAREARAQREAEQSRMRAEYLARIHEAEAQLWEYLHPLMKAAADYRAEESFGYIGAAFVSEMFYPAEFVQEVREEGMGPYVSVHTVFADSPAEKAGLKRGDKLLRVNDRKAPRGDSAGIFAARKVKRLLIPEETNTLLIERDGEQLDIELTPEAAPYYGLIVMPNGRGDLHVDGDVIWLSIGLVENLESNEDLSYICAYVVAQSVMRHAKKKGRNTFLGQMVDVAAALGGVPTGGAFGSMGERAYAAGFAIESDLVALYLLASLEYDISGYSRFWERSLKTHSRSGELNSGEEERLLAMEKVIMRIEEKRAAGEDIYPEEYLGGDVSEIE